MITYTHTYTCVYLLLNHFKWTRILINKIRVKFVVLMIPVTIDKLFSLSLTAYVSNLYPINWLV